MNKLIRLYVNAQSKVRSIAKDEKGATMVEYALMVSLIAVACILGVTALGGGVDSTFASATGAL